MKIISRSIVVLVILTLSLLGMIALKQWTLLTGKLILLETQPIDPRSLFRGDYVILNYSINRLKLNDLAGDNTFIKNEPAYVVLEQGKHYWQPVSVHATPPLHIERNRLMIKGKVQRFSKHNSGFVQIKFGIENYFVPEGEGLVLENSPEDKQVEVQVAVDSSGNAAIKAILINDEIIYLEKLF